LCSGTLAWDQRHRYECQENTCCGHGTQAEEAQESEEAAAGGAGITYFRV